MYVLHKQESFALRPSPFALPFLLQLIGDNHASPTFLYISQYLPSTSPTGTRAVFVRTADMYGTRTDSDRHGHVPASDKDKDKDMSLPSCGGTMSTQIVWDKVRGQAQNVRHRNFAPGAFCPRDRPIALYGAAPIPARPAQCTAAHIYKGRSLHSQGYTNVSHSQYKRPIYNYTTTTTIC